MRIAFFANHGKTQFFRAVQRGLEERGHEIYWIVPGNRLARFLVRSGLAKDHVLDLTTLAARWSQGTPHGPWKDGGLLAGPLQLNEMIGADRFLREYPFKLALAYLSTCAEAIIEFVGRAEIKAVVGEQTYALELLTSALLQEMSIPYLVPATVRLPSERFGLFPGALQANFATALTPDAKSIREAADFVSRFTDRPERPYYFAGQQGYIRAAWSWLLSPMKQIALQVRDPHELNRPRLTWLLRARVRQWMNGQLNRRYPFAEPESVLGKPYVLLTLHRQPEASLDVMGSKFADQAALVRTVAFDLPTDWVLVVKEHSNGLGDRGPAFFRQIRRVPGTVLVNPWSDSLQLAAGAQLTLTVSGTVAFEAGLLGYPATTFTQMYFSSLMVAPSVNPYSNELRSLISRLGRDVRIPDKGSRIQFMAHVLANSRPGLIGAPEDTPECMTPMNVGLVADGLDDLLGAALETDILSASE